MTTTSDNTADRADPLEAVFAARATGAYEDAHVRAEDTLETSRAEHGERSIPVVRALLAVGLIEEDLGRHQGAERRYRLARAIATEIGTDAGLRVECGLRLANLWRVRGRYPEAAELLRTTLRAAEQAFGSGAIPVAGICNALAITDKYAGRFGEAQQLYERALAIIERMLGAEHPDAASIHHNLGGLAHARGDFARAEGPARQAVTIQERALSPAHPDVAADKAALAAVLDAPRPGRGGRAPATGGPGGLRRPFRHPSLRGRGQPA